MIKSNKLNRYGFTLVEILVGILIFSLIIIVGFEALTSVNVGKVKLIEKTDIIKDSYYFSERLFEEIKAGGTLDFEEYFNRKVVGTATSSGHYTIQTGFGNFGSGGVIRSTNYGSGIYYCASPNGSSMGSGGCFTNGNKQRYGQYAFQFIDYNSNLDGDGGDEDGDGNIRGDDDDENLGLGPTVFTQGQNVREIYLISGDRKKRTLFRWNWKRDSKAPVGATCNGSSSVFGSGCLGTIEILKLEGKDWGINHNSGGYLYLDGIIDTWIIDPKFSGSDGIIAGSNDTNYRQPIFTDNISVSNFEVFAYPNINRNYAWKDMSNHTNINPYIRINITLTPSGRKKIV